jgi:hypothetical protein
MDGTGDMAKQTGGGCFKEPRLRQEKDKTKVRELTGIFQTMHGLIDAEDHKTLAVASGANEGEERKTDKDCRGVRVHVDADKLALEER